MWRFRFTRRKPSDQGASQGDPDAGELSAAGDGDASAEIAAAAAAEEALPAETAGGEGAPRRRGPLLRIREDLPGWTGWALGVVPILLLLGLWWLVTGAGPAEERMISPTILPSPLEVAQSLPSLWFDRALTRNVAVSLSRVVAGFLVGAGIAFPLGLMMGSFTKVKLSFQPLSVLGAYLPIPALVPLTLSLFGTGERQKVAFLGLAFVIYLLPLIVAAVDNVDSVYLKTAYTLGATRWQAVRKVLLAISWPEIYQSMRLGFGIGWSYILLAEMVDIGRGLGGIIIISQRRGPREHIYLVLLVIVALAFLTDKLWSLGAHYLFPHKRAGRR
ncbi:MAG: ABC transporter permease subunit [Thermoanaerobaculia bacterium]|nr:ABC transporter permease subunit [Thermoanaerobaculia bacterium]